MSDLINRKTVISVAESCTFTSSYDRTRYMDLLNYCLNTAPTVDAVPVVHAKWILAFSEEENVWKCSVCDKYWLLNNGTPFDNEMNFCPKCGAKMDLR